MVTLTMAPKTFAAKVPTGIHESASVRDQDPFRLDSCHLVNAPKGARIEVGLYFM